MDLECYLEVTPDRTGKVLELAPILGGGLTSSIFEPAPQGAGNANPP